MLDTSELVINMIRLMALVFFGKYRGQRWQNVATTAAAAAASTHGVSNPADAFAHGQAESRGHDVTHGAADAPRSVWRGPHESHWLMTGPIMPDPGRKSMADTVRTLGALSTVGFSFVLAIVIGAWLGWLLDRWLGTSPWLFFLFFVLGLAAGVLNVYRTAGKFLK